MMFFQANLAANDAALTRDALDPYVTFRTLFREVRETLRQRRAQRAASAVATGLPAEDGAHSNDIKVLAARCV